MNYVMYYNQNGDYLLPKQNSGFSILNQNGGFSKQNGDFTVPESSGIGQLEVRRGCTGTLYARIPNGTSIWRKM